MNLNKKAFTLIEILVVVLIIGILAAIAVPKYQIAVEKSNYSTLKEKTRAIAEAVNMYKLATGTYPREFSELDVSLPNISSAPRTNEGERYHFTVYFQDGNACTIWISPDNMVACYSNVGKHKYMGFYYSHTQLRPLLCLSNKNYDAGNKVCQQETNKTIEQAYYCTDDYSYCTYYY